MKQTYFRQAWQLLRQNKLFSAIYIIGTALAIASTTIFAIIYYVRLAPVYPEYQKERILTLSKLCYDSPRRNYHQYAPGVSYKAMDECFYRLKNADAVSAYYEYDQLTPVVAPGRKSTFDIAIRYADPAHFDIINYEYISGRPFSQAEFDAGRRTVAISDVLAGRLGLDVADAPGKTVNIGFVDYEICGVYREGSAINVLSYAQAIAPYKAISNYYWSYPECHVLGPFSLLILSDNPDDVRAEIEDYFRKYSAAEMDGHEIYTFGQPHTAITSALSTNPEFEIDIMGIIRQNILILLTLLIVPALNLSGMIAGRMDSRMGELGIRKSFGATRLSLLSQVLWENLWLTLIGGVIGLGITWMILSTDAISTFTAIMSTSNRLNDPSVTFRITPDMLFAPAIFVLAFIFCVLLNIMSAIIPAYSALRRPIVKSLK